MTLNEYLAQYGSLMQDHMRSYVRGLASDSGYGRHIRGGVLQFTPETASSWGGPFEGGFAAYRLTDHRSTVSIFDRRPKARKRTGREPLPKLLIELGDEYMKDHHPLAQQDMVTTAKPFELRMYGNDDTSYTKFYASEASALEELNLFEASQPLDFREITRGFGFSFTN